MIEILEELKVLKKKIDETSGTENSFAKTLFAITNKLTRSELFNMTDEELIKHIQKVQIRES